MKVVVIKKHHWIKKKNLPLPWFRDRPVSLEGDRWHEFNIVEALWRRIHASASALHCMSVMVAMVMFLVSSAEALGCVWEMNHSHRWSPVGSLFMFGFQVVKERINGLLKNIRYRMENPRGDTMLQEGGVGLLLGVRGRRVCGGGRLHSRHWPQPFSEGVAGFLICVTSALAKLVQGL